MNVTAHLGELFFFGDNFWNIFLLKSFCNEFMTKIDVKHECENSLKNILKLTLTLWKIYENKRFTFNTF